MMAQGRFRQQDAPLQHFFDWFAQQVGPDEPWLILGKGPSFALRDRTDLGRYRLLSLNHAVREQPVLLAHAIDLNVVETCADLLESNARFLVMPWFPHVDNRPGSLSLEQARADLPVLRRLSESGRLLWYDLRTSQVRHGPGPVVQASYFSAEAALSLLALAGARRVSTLGVDGGSDYSTHFDDLRDKTLLANGRTTFDLQFEGFARTILDTGVDVAALQAPAPVRICVAPAEGEALPVAVLHHSIRRHASLTVELMTERRDGPAIVMTPRAYCMGDVRPLWLAGVGEDEIAIPVAPPGNDDAVGLALVGPGARGEVARLASMLREGPAAARLAGAFRATVRARLRAEWNPGTPTQPRGRRFLRFESDGSEPWLSRSNPVGHLWVRDLLDAIDRRFIQPEVVAAEIRRGHVRPSLGYQVEHRIEEPMLLPRRARRLDRGFRSATGGLVATSVAVAQALARRVERRIAATSR